MIKDGSLIGTRKQMIQLITQISFGDYASLSKREDSLLRLWCVLNLVDFWMEELAIDKSIGIDQRLFDAQEQVREKFSQVVNYDWVVTRLEKNDLEERARLLSRASDALKVLRPYHQMTKRSATQFSLPHSKMHSAKSKLPESWQSILSFEREHCN